MKTFRIKVTVPIVKLASKRKRRLKRASVTSKLVKEVNYFKTETLKDVLYDTLSLIRFVGYLKTYSEEKTATEDKVSSAIKKVLKRRGV